MRYILTILLFCSTALAGSLPLLKYRALDNDGDPVSGAKLYFYEAGTTTPTATYSDEALSSANANPVVADGNGWFGEFYMQTDQEYKVVMKSSDGATTYFTVDNVNAGQLVSDSFQTRLEQAATNPLDQGAVGDGAADEQTEVQAAIDAATGVVDLLGKTYRIDSSLLIDTGQNGVVIKNGTLNFANSTSNSYINITGSVGGLVLLASDTAVGGLTFDVASASGLAADDWLLLASQGTWATSSVLGEIVQIDSISGTTVTLRSPLDAAHTQANTAYIMEITPVSGVRFENVHFIASTSASGTGDIVSVTYGENITFRDCTFENIKNTGIIALHSDGIVVDGCTFEEDDAAATGVYAFGVVQNLRVTNSTFSRMALGVSLGSTGTGQVRHTAISGNKFVGVTQGVLANIYTQYTDIIDNDIVCDTSGAAGSGDGIEVLGFKVAVRGNTVREAGGYGISVDMSNLSGGLLGPYDSMDVSGNSVFAADNDGIYITECQNGVVSGNYVYGAGTDGIVINNTDYTDIVGNTISTSGGDGIYISGGDISLQIAGNSIYNSTSHGISVSGTTISGVTISGNGVRTFGKNGIDITTSNSSYWSIIGNSVVGATGAGYSNIKLYGTSLQRVVVTGNTLVRVDDLDDNVQLAGTGAGNVNNVSFTNNFLFNGAHGIGEPTDANNTSIFVGYNNYTSMATDNVEGTVNSDMTAASGNNTACNTTCGKAGCFAGYDTGGSVFVGCASEDADTCLCF